MIEDKEYIKSILRDNFKKELLESIDKHTTTGFKIVIGSLYIIIGLLIFIALKI